MPSSGRAGPAPQSPTLAARTEDQAAPFQAGSSHPINITDFFLTRRNSCDLGPPMKVPTEEKALCTLQVFIERFGLNDTLTEEKTFYGDS